MQHLACLPSTTKERHPTLPSLPVVVPAPNQPHRFPGGFREVPAEDLHSRDSTKVRCPCGRPSRFISPPPPLPPSPSPYTLLFTTSTTMQVIWKAVNGMLPKTTLRQKWMRKLHIFPDEVSHRHHPCISHLAPSPHPSPRHSYPNTPPLPPLQDHPFDENVVHRLDIRGSGSAALPKMMLTLDGAVEPPAGLTAVEEVDLLAELEATGSTK